MTQTPTSPLIPEKKSVVENSPFSILDLSLESIRVLLLLLALVVFYRSLLSGFSITRGQHVWDLRVPPVCLQVLLGQARTDPSSHPDVQKFKPTALRMAKA